MSKKETYICPRCGEKMDECDETLWCPECDFHFWREYYGCSVEHIEMMEEDCRRNSNLDDVPEGCSACGGPYPDCISSCPLFDDED